MGKGQSTWGCGAMAHSWDIMLSAMGGQGEVLHWRGDDQT